MRRLFTHAIKLKQLHPSFRIASKSLPVGEFYLPGVIQA